MVQSLNSQYGLILIMHKVISIFIFSLNICYTSNSKHHFFFPIGEITSILRGQIKSNFKPQWVRLKSIEANSIVLKI